MLLNHKKDLIILVSNKRRKRGLKGDTRPESFRNL
jgi:hypothetical protein